jgi:uncharacterized membrane protein
VSARRLRQVLIATTLLAYAALEHYSNTAHASRALGACLAVTPLLLALGLLAVRAPRPVLAVSLLVLAAALLLPPLWLPLERQYVRLYLLQQCGLYLTLAATFGRTLLPGGTPLCTQWALRIHGVLDARVQRYTRGVTLAWTLFFVAVLVCSVSLYATVARTTWSLFTNFLILPLAVLLFAAEYRLRRLRLPAMPRASIGQMLGAYLAEPRGTRRP